MASAETVGTVLTIAIVVSVITVAALHAVPAEPALSESPATRVTGEARAGDDRLILTHGGGADIAKDGVRVVVTAGADTLYDGPLGPSGTFWHTGDAIALALDAAIPSGVELRTSITLPGTRPVTLDVAEMRVDVAAPTQGQTGLEARIPGPSLLVAQGTDSVLFQAYATHSEGRKLIKSVVADVEGLDLAPATLVDDGTVDSVAHDGIYAGYVQVPLGAPPGDYPVVITITDLYGATATVTGILRIPGEATTVTPPAPPPPPFDILPSGGIRPTCSGPMGIEVVGVDITQGFDGPRIPVFASTTLDGGSTMTPYNAGAPVWTGMRETAYVTPASIVGVRGTANGLGFYSTYTSFQSDPHVRVLRDGDTPPDVPAFGTIQQDIATYLAPYVSDGRMDLAFNEAIVLFEFVRDLSSSAADFQDLVVLFDFSCNGAPTHYPGSSNVPCTSLPGGAGWSELRVDPPRVGTFTSGALTVTITNFDGKQFDWSSNLGVDAVYVKAGSQGSYLYVYDPEATSGTGLQSPGEVGNSISHISFCWD